MTSVFISYSSKDRRIADYIADELRKRGADVFIDYQRLKGGDDFIERLALEIEKREITLLLLSKSSLNSKWVRREINYADRHNKPIIPIILEDFEESKQQSEDTQVRTFAFLLNSVHRVDFRGFDSNVNPTEVAIKRLASALNLPEVIPQSEVIDVHIPIQKKRQENETRDSELPVTTKDLPNRVRVFILATFILVVGIAIVAGMRLLLNSQISNLESTFTSTPTVTLTTTNTASPTQIRPTQPITATSLATVMSTALVTQIGINTNSPNSCTHIVEPGDNLYRIALKYNLSLQELRDANPQISGDFAQPGDRLEIPDCETTPGADGVSPTPVSTIIATPLSGGSQTYVVQSGDTLYSIAVQFGVTIADIQAANDMDNPNRLTVGQELVIPTPIQ